MANYVFSRLLHAFVSNRFDAFRFSFVQEEKESQKWPMLALASKGRQQTKALTR